VPVSTSRLRPRRHFAQKAHTASHFTAEPANKIRLMSERSVLRAFGIALLAAAASACSVRGGDSETHALASTRPAQETPVATARPPSIFQPGPDFACSHAGGTYLGGLKCQLPDGSIDEIRVVSAETKMSEIPVSSKSPQAWALATTAILFELNGTRHDLLGGAVTLPENAEWGRKLLSQWWGASSRDQLLEMLRWLQFEGHRGEFEELGRQVDAMNEEQFKTAEAALLGDPEQLHSLQVVRQNHRSLGQSGILAWDLVRYIALCRWGYLAGYLSQTEAWGYIMPAARRLQETFSSWEALQNDYLIGREFWSLQQTQKNGERYRSIFERFIQDPNSPWNRNPWSMDLRETGSDHRPRT
jgi:hypothetical protein